MNHDFLKPEEITSIKSIISTKIAEVEDFLHPDPMFKSSSENMMADMVDRATLEEERQEEQNKSNRAKQQLLILKGTLRRLDTEPEDYGFCKSCGIEIEYKRLASVPTADKCVDCQNLSEIKERQKSH